LHVTPFDGGLAPPCYFAQLCDFLATLAISYR